MGFVSMDYLLLIASVFLAIANSAILHHFGSHGLKNTGDILWFNAATSLVWVLVVLCVGGGFACPSNATWFWGCSYGVVTAAFFLSKMQALARGDISTTVMIGCCSLVLPTVFGSIFWHESIAPIQWIGLVLLLAALIMSVDRKNAGEPRPGWKRCCALFFVVSGLSGLIFKAHQNSSGKTEAAEFLLIASVVAATLLGALAIFVNRAQGAPKPKIPRAALKYALICGTCSCAYSWLNVRLTGALPSVVFFPVFNGGVILGSSLAGCFCFRERLTRRQIIGLVSGLFSLILIGKVFG